MAADPFVAPELDDEPRQLQNLAPGVRMPAARAWYSDRPGDEVSFGQPQGRLFGVPGPNIGYARTLAERLGDRLNLAPHERLDDALAVVSELAMKRAASFGRAPVMPDLDVGAHLLGYLGGCDPDDAVWRTAAVDGADHDYNVRRAVCDAVDLSTLRLPPDEVRGRALELRRKLPAVWRPADA